MAMTKDTVAVTYTPKFAYVTNASAGTVSAYTIDASTGALTPHIDGAVGTRGNTPFSGTADPAGRFAYAANINSSNIAAYTIVAADGGLTPIDAVPATPLIIDNFTTELGPESITVEPSGRFLYVAASSADNVSGFRINANGSLSPIGGAATGNQPRFVAVDPAGMFAYVVNFNASSVSAYTINGTSGLPTRIDADPVAPGIQDFPTGAGPRSIAVDPTGKFAYVTNSNDNDVSAYAINAVTGALTSIGADAPAGIGPISVTIDPSGRFAYVANATGNVSAYTIDAATGVLNSIGAAVLAGTGPRSISVDPSGRFAYVANFDSDDVSIYSIDASTGALTPIGTAAAGDGAFTVTVTAAIQ
jgi:6-phosphogluconolactonase (cycloisomerase 2 family)